MSHFWGALHREVTRHHLTARSIQQKAINNLKSILKINNYDALTPLKGFVRTLLEDILDYGTLSDYTVRRLSNLNIIKPASLVKEIKKLRQELGEDYLEGEKERLKSLSKEIIIAIENRK